LVLREALELRKFRRRAPGMDLADLNRGDTSRRGGKKDKTAAADADNDDPWKLKSGGGLINMDQVRGMTFGGDDADKAATTAGGGFATESNAMDTERHMREFIEKEMRKRRGDDGGAAGPSGGAETTDSKDPHDELFQIPDHLKVTISAPVSEGNVTLSTSMLTAIPEIDLGITSKLKNIEETEKAKRKLIERNTSV
ncbi:hepatocellular carcinoma-associated antigen 59-domain-containing protein, partial [Powellomyces hirtus]